MEKIHQTAIKDDAENDAIDSVTDDDTVMPRVPDNQGRAWCCGCQSWGEGDSVLCSG